MENWDEFIGSITASVLKKGVKEDTTIGIIVSALDLNPGF